ncbi:AMP-binding enzyme C-terminal domain protein [Bordetella bronchiseptica F4563]|nr:AMP-binding enzyme C-terminal domain protein [Bordetella bronchiseptica CA90 BB02]KDC31827.1 AMP-binding enzyme C-terminal domain protein [Bordetella bronchiseptica F4563]KDD95928.1 AMP-binding enzyme C-terminal domain protein [Bordetella bronchiseptica MO275]
MSIRGKAYIVGAFEHPLRYAPAHSVAQLHAECALGALADAGLTLADVDGYFCAGDAGASPATLVDHMNLRLRHVDGTEIGGGSYLALIGHAAQAIASGKCRVALITLAGKPRSAGQARDSVRVRIVDDDDFDLPADSPGEILLRVEQPWGTPLGYYKMPEATLAAHRNGWFHTGDRGRLDADGYLHFTDRKKDAIRRRGENISAYEVEAIILGHPAVRQAAVYPVRSEFTEDEVAASIVLHDGQALTPEALVLHCRDNMSSFMVPRFVEFVAELPLTLTNKVEKYKLRARAEADPAALWDSQQHAGGTARAAATGG